MSVKMKMRNLCAALSLCCVSTFSEGMEMEGVGYTNFKITFNTEKEEHKVVLAPSDPRKIANLENASKIPRAIKSHNGGPVRNSYENIRTIYTPNLQGCKNELLSFADIEFGVIKNDSDKEKINQLSANMFLMEFFNEGKFKNYKFSDHFELSKEIIDGIDLCYETKNMYSEACVKSDLFLNCAKSLRHIVYLKDFDSLKQLRRGDCIYDKNLLHVSKKLLLLGKNKSTDSLSWEYQLGQTEKHLDEVTKHIMKIDRELVNFGSIESTQDQKENRMTRFSGR